MHCVRLAHVPLYVANSGRGEDSLTAGREFPASRNVWRTRGRLLALFRRPTFSHYVSRRASSMSAYQLLKAWRKSSSIGRHHKSANRNRVSRRPTIETLEGRAMMTFLTPTNLAAGTSPAGIAVGDYNHDGKADMAVVDQSSSRVNLMVSTGNGSFEDMGSYYANAGAIDAAFGDFNGDGNNDLAVVSTTGSLSVLSGKSTVSSMDYVMWRKNQGAAVTPGSPGDADKSGSVDDADYSLLR